MYLTTEFQGKNRLIFYLSVFLFPVNSSLYYKVNNKCYSKHYQNMSNVRKYPVPDLIYIISYDRKNNIPYPCSDKGVQHKTAEIHLCESCGNGDKMTDSRDKLREGGLAETELDLRHFPTLGRAVRAFKATAAGDDPDST